MTLPFFIFLIICALFGTAVVLFLRRALSSIAAIAAVHAKTYAVAYIKGGALVVIAMLAAFEQAFAPLTAAQAAGLSWWDWAILFFKPLAAGLAVIVAFLDRSITRAEEKPASTP